MDHELVTFNMPCAASKASSRGLQWLEERYTRLHKSRGLEYLLSGVWPLHTTFALKTLLWHIVQKQEKNNFWGILCIHHWWKPHLLTWDDDVDVVVTHCPKTGEKLYFFVLIIYDNSTFWQIRFSLTYWPVMLMLIYWCWWRVWWC